MIDVREMLVWCSIAATIVVLVGPWILWAIEMYANWCNTVQTRLEQRKYREHRE